MPTSGTIPRSALSADNLALIEAVSRLGSMAAAARELGMVPSALTYRVRQIEDALDVLLFDRSARRAVLTPAGAELLRAGEYLLNELDAVAQRVKRVATGWEPQLTIAADALIARDTLFELCEAFYATGAPTQLRIRSETLSGTLEVLQNGLADLALGIAAQISSPGLQSATLGSVSFVYAVAPHHPLAAVEGSLSEQDIRPHRAVAVADSTQRGRGMSHNLLPGQDVLTVPTMHHKLEAQLRGLGSGFLPLPLAQPYIAAGRLVVKSVQQTERQIRVAYGWHSTRVAGDSGRALRWWLDQLKHERTRDALLNRHHQQ
ncbi:MAG: LysR family transcriptional regulator [Hydrogenophaga sp.]|uniref:LysR family transcriptional regulator n=1 Tax=Hydrogenophaga crocea TaxID=2716225 RepID=A0A6G8IDZ1_9BURK|nr:MULTISPECIES: LysR family transcriptional regulator [Hydrogenophaga]MBL0943467.1 LysR family transcriptional regulator [Hydrogenophaga sp.]QIM51407.1 LysR family transcriptional regulator [Hydrogenophaga crocea]